jgi:hypothetical protein
MSKYRELPAKPRNVHAVQYTGVDKGVPTWNEPAPAWVLAAFAKGHLQVIDGGLHCRGKSLDLGSWLLVDEDLNVDGIWSVMAISFIQKYTVARKKAVRKPRVVKAAA